MASLEVQKSPQAYATVREKPEHLTYLQDFRVDPCALFKQHTCQNHRPYTCFSWHFVNQRRRRCVLRSDGTFNYSPDIYCVKYDESTGVCPDDDRCPFLHRVYGDIERKYHLRYYKTTLCVHATDVAGHCMKNGLHCPFAHGPDDLREPVFELRDSESTSAEDRNTVELLEHRDRLSYVVEDPIWEDQEHVLAYYKTELCKKPPRLCRQGYACPFYHNSKDRRRSPLEVKYRSTPCPSVKHADEWSSPESCESGDMCSYCHTRTEQQFHPEIYKSSKCNDMLQHGYCPRSSFCAFAHTDGELCAERVPSRKQRHGGSFSSFSAGSFSSPSDSGFTSCGELAKAQSGSSRLSASYADSVAEGNVLRAVRTPGTAEAPVSYSSVLKQRRYTMPTPRSIAGKAESQPEAAYSYPKAPGFERGYHSPYRERASSTLLPSNIDKVNKSIFGYYDPTVYESGSIPSAHSLVSDYYSSSLRAACNKYEPVENLNALIGSLADDLNMDDVVLPTINESEERHADAPIPFGGLPSYFTQTSAATYDSHLSVATTAASVKTAERCPQGYSPVGDSCHGTLSVSSNGYFNFGEDNLLVKMQQTAAVAQHAVGPGGYRDSAEVFTPLSPSVTQASRVDVMPFCEGTISAGTTSRFGGMDLDECLLRTTKTCEVWKREAEEQRRRALIAEQEKLQAISERDDAFRQLACMQLEMQLIKAGNLPASTSADAMNAYQLEELKNRLQVELEKVNRQLQHNAGPMCARCGRHVNDRLPSVHCPVCTPSCKVGAGSPAMA
ncbi:hypothetical protein M514_01320 [Trichuris suis]|uniref:C3H1-type domain-containing protein n=1 Tax=Trichuris suis TaxID=68888 RepID=A0A085NS19_9BILA|nr:hypothetical protein M514_01320 [Trichuris suis]